MGELLTEDGFSDLNSPILDSLDCNDNGKLAEFDNETNSFDEIHMIDKFARGDIFVQRLYHVCYMAEVAQKIGYQNSAPTFTPLCKFLSGDKEADIRQAVVEQLPQLAKIFVSDGTDQALQDVAVFLNISSKLLIDDIEDVRKSAEKALTDIVNVVRSIGVTLKGDIVDTIISLGGSRIDIQRVCATYLLVELSGALDEYSFEKKAIPFLNALSIDSEFRVRKAIASGIPNCIQAQNDNLEIIESSLLPVFISLCKDEAWCVRMACAEGMLKIAENLSPSLVSTYLIPFLEKFSKDDSSRVRDATLQILDNFFDLLKEYPDQVIFLFSRLCEPFPIDDRFSSYCAFNFPNVLQSVGAEKWVELEDVYFSLLTSKQPRVRSKLGYSLFDLACVLGSEFTEKNLLYPFRVLLSDIDEVRMGVVKDLSSFISILPKPSRLHCINLLPSIFWDEEDKLHFHPRHLKHLNDESEINNDEPSHSTEDKEENQLVQNDQLKQISELNPIFESDSSKQINESNPTPEPELATRENTVNNTNKPENANESGNPNDSIDELIRIELEYENGEKGTSSSMDRTEECENGKENSNAEANEVELNEVADSGIKHEAEKDLESVEGVQEQKEESAKSEKNEIEETFEQENEGKQTSASIKFSIQPPPLPPSTTTSPSSTSMPASLPQTNSNRDSNSNLNSSVRIAAWQFRHAVAKQLRSIAILLNATDLSVSFLDFAIALCRDPVASVRMEAAKQIGDFVSLLAKIMERNEAMKNAINYAFYLLIQLSSSANYRDRQMFAISCAELMKGSSRSILVHRILPHLIPLAHDPIPNVRIRVAHAFVEGSLFCDGFYNLPQVKPTIDEMLNDNDFDVAYVASQAQMHSLHHNAYNYHHHSHYQHHEHPPSHQHHQLHFPLHPQHHSLRHQHLPHPYSRHHHSVSSPLPSPPPKSPTRPHSRIHHGQATQNENQNESQKENQSSSSSSFPSPLQIEDASLDEKENKFLEHNNVDVNDHVRLNDGNEAEDVTSNKNDSDRQGKCGNDSEVECTANNAEFKEVELNEAEKETKIVCANCNENVRSDEIEGSNEENVENVVHRTNVGTRNEKSEMDNEEADTHEEDREMVTEFNGDHKEDEIRTMADKKIVETSHTFVVRTEITANNSEEPFDCNNECKDTLNHGSEIIEEKGNVHNNTDKNYPANDEGNDDDSNMRLSEDHCAESSLSERDDGDLNPERTRLELSKTIQNETTRLANNKAIENTLPKLDGGHDADNDKQESETGSSLTEIGRGKLE